MQVVPYGLGLSVCRKAVGRKALVLILALSGRSSM